MQIEILEFDSHKDNRGQLVALEQNKNIPFEIKRVYYMFDTYPNFIRGKHAHKCLEQILVCVNGSCKILLDDGKEKEIVELNDPSKGIYISNNIWREMFDFSEGAVLMAIASDYYNESDYIRNYDEFLKYVGVK